MAGMQREKEDAKRERGWCHGPDIPLKAHSPMTGRHPTRSQFLKVPILQARIKALTHGPVERIPDPNHSTVSQITTDLAAHDEIIYWLIFSTDQEKGPGMAGSSAQSPKADIKTLAKETTLSGSFSKCTGCCWQSSISCVIVGLKSLLSCWLSIRGYLQMLEAF